MWNANSGYCGYSMSWRAVEAYDNGFAPKSKWTKTRIIDQIEAVCDDMTECTFDIEKLKGMTKADLWEKFVEWKEWHHTGKYFQRTDFYGIDEYMVEEVFTDK